MKKQDKIYTVDNLTVQLKEAKSVILADYRGLTVAQMGNLRAQVKKGGGELLVIKNTLLARALSNLNMALPEEDLTGPTAILITTGENELLPLKALTGFAKTNGLPNLKSGLWEDRVLEKSDLERLSLLPGKDELLNRLTGVLTSPTTRLVQVITNNPKKLIILLKKMEGGEQVHD